MQAAIITEAPQFQPFDTTVTARVQLVTPEMAAMLLERKDPNRPLSRPYVRELRRELEEGRWQVTHQGVAFTPDGGLLDGQHRLTAIAESGIAAPMMVAENVAKEAFGAIDQHRKRTGGQILAMGGITKDAPRMVAMSRAILQVVHGNARTSNTAAAEFALAHQDELEAYLPVARRYTPAVGAAFAWCAILGWPEVKDAAQRLVDNGPWVEPQETDPMRALANRSREFAKLGAGQSGIKARFDIALNCLQAVHEDRPLRVARSSRPDYQAIERESLAPRESDAMRSVHAPKHQAYGSEFAQTTDRQARVEYEAEHDDSAGVSLSPPEITDEHAELLTSSLETVKKRRSFLSPQQILDKATKAGE